MSSSSSGRIWSSASSSSTSVPSRPSAEAISVPEAPAPMTASRGAARSAATSPRRVEDPPAELQVQQRLRDRPGGQDHPLRLDLRPVELAADLHVAVVGDRAEPFDQVDLVLLEQTRDSPVAS